MPPDQSEEGKLWWNNHDPRIPRHTPSSAAEDELFKNGYSGEAPMTANYLRRVYETKEIEFKLTSGVNVPKFRLAALQQLFGPVFFERKRCFPMVLVDSLVAKVWKNLRFERLICTLLRDSDEKIVLGALSLLDCSTRVFRFDLLRSPTDRSTPLSSYSYTCPERDFAIQLCSQSVVSEVKRVLDKTIRALKVLGESGASSASRSQHPLVAILCVGISWLVNCLRGGDNATQFWGVAGINQLIIAHCKANSLPFVKIKDLNMMNQFFHKAQRVVPDFSTKWRVFASESTRRNCSPFHLILEEIIYVGSTRAVGLVRTLLLSHTFREEADDATVATRDSTFQRDLMSSVDYGKVSHAIDLARDISHMNGTINEQMHVILYVKALFVNYAATSMKVHVRGFAPVCKEIWSWMETAWKNVALHSSPTLIETDKGVKLSRAQGDVIIAGFSLLHLIISHPAVLIEDIVELTTFNAQDSGESVNVAHELVRWVKILPNGARRKGNTIHVLIESGAALLTNFIHARKYDEVAFATLNTCVSVRKMLELLDCTILSIEEKRQLWSMLLYFDSRTVTSRILDTNFLDTAVFTRLLQSNSLRHRLEALMFLEVLVVAASRCAKSVNTQMLFAEVCKLLLHHDLIAKEATFLRKTRDFGNISSKQVAVCKRVMQVVCCLCVDFSSQSPSRIFLDQLEAVGVPAWVVAFHQAKDAKLDIADNDPRVDVFWKDWQGCVAVATKLSFEPRCKPKKTVAQTVPYSVSQTLSHDRRRKNPSVKVETMSSDEDEVKLKRALVSPVKLSKPKRTATRAQKSASVIQALLTDSALHVVKRSTKPATRKPKDAADDEALDSDAYSPFPGNISSEEGNRKFSEASAKRNPSKKKAAESKHSKNKVEQDISDGELSVSSPDQPRKRTFSRKTSKNRATPPQNEALQVIFRKYDVDGDGVISFIDLRRAMDNQLIGRTHRLSDVEIQRWITEKDRSGQGVVSFEDFAIAFQTQASQ
ncbi:hypothetical protein F443_02078 [Phytophthora nicotianae P1569]|uniref:EF-hand domain-containing protein n=1 Tax=Phytophthora nicotianae P1569 TaxID=1317065 RepID=V9FUN0_PHYNI|nr:hypothetical protein F443_02078 [Phytophthora nicotianae P1569]